MCTISVLCDRGCRSCRTPTIWNFPSVSVVSSAGKITNFLQYLLVSKPSRNCFGQKVESEMQCLMPVYDLVLVMDRGEPKAIEAHNLSWFSLHFGENRNLSF